MNNEINLWSPGPENHYPNQHLKRWKYLGQNWTDKTFLVKRFCHVLEDMCLRSPSRWDGDGIQRIQDLFLWNRF